MGEGCRCAEKANAPSIGEPQQHLASVGRTRTKPGAVISSATFATYADGPPDLQLLDPSLKPSRQQSPNLTSSVPIRIAKEMLYGKPGISIVMFVRISLTYHVCVLGHCGGMVIEATATARTTARIQEILRLLLLAIHR